MASIEVLRRVMASAYEVSFPADVALSQQVILPATVEERNGIEDARFVRFHDDGQIDYRATYTAYDGQQIAPRLLISPDLRTFRAHRLAGPAARNKGMALFPAQDQWPALGSMPIRRETQRGVVIRSRSHLGPADPRAAAEGVLGSGADRQLRVAYRDRPGLAGAHAWGRPDAGYAVGAILLDLNDPTRITCRLAEPLLEARLRRARRLRSQRRLLLRRHRP